MEKHLKLVSISFAAVTALAVPLLLATRVQSPEPTSPVPVSAVAPPEDNTKIVSVVAPNGKMSAKLTRDAVSYKLEVTDNVDDTTKQIYSANATDNVSFTLPDNTFSPDDKYLFIERDMGDKSTYLVMKTSGDDVVKDKKTVEVTSLFYEKYNDFKITDVTGWAAPTLLVINTDKKEGGIGPSFWYELPNGPFIRLSTRFN